MELKPCPFCDITSITLSDHKEDCYLRLFASEHYTDDLRERYNIRPIEAALRARISELEEAQRWIPCSERMPQKNDRYFVAFVTNSFTYMSVARYSTKLFEFDQAGITHWMPLPPPPSSE